MATFNLNTDMDKFMKSLESDIKDSVRIQLEQETYEVECPKCGTVFEAPAGKSKCPACKEEINLKLDINL